MTIDITKPVRMKHHTQNDAPITQLHEIAGRLVGNFAGGVLVWDKNGQGLDNKGRPYATSIFNIENVPEPPSKCKPVLWRIKKYPDGLGWNGYTSYVNKEEAEKEAREIRKPVEALCVCEEYVVGCEPRYKWLVIKKTIAHGGPKYYVEVYDTKEEAKKRQYDHYGYTTVGVTYCYTLRLNLDTRETVQDG